MSSFPLEIVTPDKKFFSGEVEMVIVRGIDGDLAILSNRAPFVTPLGVGKIRVKRNGKERVAAISGGYIEVTKERTVIVADSIEWPEEIDVKRAEEAKETAERRLGERKDGIDVARAEYALKRAINRLDVANLKKIDDDKIDD